MIASSNSYAYFVDYFKVQHAGEIGYYSFGIGKEFSSFYSLEYFYGIVPKEIGGTYIETFTLKNKFNIYEFDFKGLNNLFYSGIGVFHVTGLDYETSQHSSYPDHYYRMGSVRGLLYLGFNIRYKKHSAYLESGVNDIVITNYLNNSDDLSITDYTSLGIGYGYKF